MAERRPLVLVSGVMKELPSGDTLPNGAVSSGTSGQFAYYGADGKTLTGLGGVTYALDGGGAHVLKLGVTATSAGWLTLSTGNGNGDVITVKPGSTGWIWTLPGNDGNNGQFLKTDGSGVTSWADLSIAVGSITGFGTGVATFLATPSSANLRAALTDEEGSGVFLTKGGDYGTPSALNLSNASALPISAISGLATGVGTFLATPSSANLRAALTDESGTGALLFAGGAMGTPSSINLSNGTNLPLSTGVTGTLGMGNGGLGVTTLTNHGVVLGQGSSSPTATSAGTAGQRLVSKGPSAHPDWQSGGDDIITTLTISNEASKTFAVDSSKYSSIEIEFVNVTPATNDTQLWIRVSTDGGSSYDTGTNYYAHWQYILGANAPATFSSSSSSLILTASMSNSTTYKGVWGTLRMALGAAGTYVTQCHFNLNYVHITGPNFLSLQGGGVYTGTSAITHVQIRCDSGNLSTGTIIVRGKLK